MEGDNVLINSFREQTKRAHNKYYFEKCVNHIPHEIWRSYDGNQEYIQEVLEQIQGFIKTHTADGYVKFSVEMNHNSLDIYALAARTNWSNRHISIHIELGETCWHVWEQTCRFFKECYYHAKILPNFRMTFYVMEKQ